MRLSGAARSSCMASLTERPLRLETSSSLLFSLEQMFKPKRTPAASVDGRKSRKNLFQRNDALKHKSTSHFRLQIVDFYLFFSILLWKKGYTVTFTSDFLHIWLLSGVTGLMVELMWASSSHWSGCRIKIQNIRWNPPVWMKILSRGFEQFGSPAVQLGNEKSVLCGEAERSFLRGNLIDSQSDDPSVLVDESLSEKWQNLKKTSFSLLCISVN